MKNKKRKLGKLLFKKSTIAGLGTNAIVGGTGTSWDGCPTFPGEPCGSDFGTDCGTGGGFTGTTCYTNNNCPVRTNACPPYTDGCQSDSICPQGVYCY
ncbi:hypothetical protein ACJD0Z_10380 [Flavobacteriaceae bacterium M23B6Z8]